MIGRIRGKLVEMREDHLLLEVAGISYEILVPGGVQGQISTVPGSDEELSLVIFHYLQNDGARTLPVLVGFANEVEREFFEKFISVSGIGPRAAVRALNRPFAQVARAVDQEDIAVLKSLPGIGAQRARQIVAQLQGKVGKYALIREEESSWTRGEMSDAQTEALEVLLQLQYTRPEAEHMIAQALERNSGICTAEELLNEVYKQRSLDSA
ncbi:MAG: hypothetical protein JW937_08250 [Candidatus Omnitrophica bacterium]|nr:hypothetical protein [Candidatus Omnitrophota bacterium]